MNTATRQRLDQVLVNRNLYETRSRARDAVLRGAVMVDGKTVTKPGQPVAPDTAITLADDARGYVSRAALKLKHALQHFAIDVAGRAALDLGASTGGFVQVLLEHGARHVDAVDVGHGQLSAPLQADPRVTSIEGLNARDLTREHVSEPVEVVTCDVSFISLKLALPPALTLAEPGATLIALIKPQFEVGRAGLGKDGVVRNETQHQQVCDQVAAWLEGEQGWHVHGVIPSPIVGADGNREYVIFAQKP